MTKIKKNKDGKVTEFTIDRAKWMTGGDTKVRAYFGTATQMLTFQGDGCCLGLYARACGARGMASRGDADPDDMEKAGKLPRQCLWLNATDGPAVGIGQELIDINDNSKLRPGEREKRIAARFSKMGIKVKFVGEYP